MGQRQEAHGTTHIRPKHHWLLDIPMQIARDGVVIDAFVVERQHLLVKGVADNVRNTTSFERSVTAGTLNASFERAKEATCGDYLLGARGPLPGCRGVLVADRMTVFGFDVVVGDVVSRGQADAGIVAGCYQEGDGTLGALVETTLTRRRLSLHSSLVARSGTVQAWASTGLNLCLAWRKTGDLDLVVVCR